MNIFFLHESLVVMIVFRLGYVESWIVQKPSATYLLNAFIDIKINCLGIFLVRRFFGENFQVPPQNIDLAFVTVPFSLLQWYLLDTSASPCKRRETNLRSHDLKISGKKTWKYKSEGNFSHIKKNPYDLWDLGSPDKSHIMRKIEAFFKSEAF